ncbi:pyocin knob domain-containing protein [Lactobacillus crispatus]|uniref:pyocin knob domain-containing protein n=1 Tax=Lactobacillus crispatus TaxID=47770 RepID=UPI0023A9139F|nr:pyocin knob domain-containing protein [Lactobacillus crispatus]WEB33829.1 pyocin knob domain-containing protein [Lactobacillus crispatus]
MSTIRDPAYITDAGRTMMTAGGDVTYTKAVLYGQDISHLTSDQVKALTTIGNPLKEVKVGISDKQNTDRGTTVILEATFQNDNLKADLPYSAVGFFAQKVNDEKLIAVAVANAGAYLTATSPDGVATDALDLKLAIAIGDATNVTATVDPAGSVTPATLNGAINKLDHDLTAQIDTKADKATVDEEIGKIDFSPYAKIVDVYSKTDANKLLDAKADKTALNSYDTITDVDSKIKTVTDLANTKVDATYSYSKDELDKKLLALSTDTNGKVNADQVSQIIADKANIADVSKQIKTVTDLVNTKANSADVYTKTETDSQIDEAKNTVQSNLDSAKKELNTAINTKANSDDIYTKSIIDSAFNTRDNNLNKAQSTADGAQTTANNALPKAGGNMNLRSTINWNGGGINDKTGNLGGLYWSGGTDSAAIYADQNANDNLDLAFDLGDDGSNHFSFRNKGGEVAAIRSNGHYTGTIDWDNIWGRPDVATHADVNNAVNPIRYAPQERRSLDANDDANNIVDDGVYRISGSPIKNGNGKSWCFLRVKRWDYNTIYQELDCGSNGIFVRNISQTNKNYPGWQRIATSDDISNLQNIINQQNQTIQSLTMRLNNAENEINYIEANYVEGKRFPASQEAQANSWENANPQRLAFITK